MATKSILKNIYINNQKLGKSLVVALENAAKTSTANIPLTKTYRDVHGNEIRTILSSKQ